MGDDNPVPFAVPAAALKLAQAPVVTTRIYDRFFQSISHHIQGKSEAVQVRRELPLSAP
jgi:hypothetical protein